MDYDPYFTIATIQHIPHSKAKRLLTTALEGGSNYWYTDLKVETLPPHTTKEDFQFWHTDLPFHPEGAISIAVAGEEGRHVLRLAKIAGGLQTLATRYTRHWNHFMNDNDDAATGDAFLQCCLFNDILFG